MVINWRISAMKKRSLNLIDFKNLSLRKSGQALTLDLDVWSNKNVSLIGTIDHIVDSNRWRAQGKICIHFLLV